MRDKKRIIEVLSRLKTVWEKYPDMRFTQLILNVEDANPFLYYKEDEDFIRDIEEYYDNLEKEKDR